jgi:ParB family transcriptional regulator, chromosome partitioning protein
VSKDKRLGRGLEALLGRLATTAPVAQTPSAVPDTAIAGHDTHPLSGPSTDDPFGGLGATYEVPRAPARRSSLPGMGSVAQSLGSLSADRPTADAPAQVAVAAGVSPTAAMQLPATMQSPAADAVAVAPPPPGLLRVPIRLIQNNPFQPRTDFGEDEIQSLCDSLRAHGLLQPLVVRAVEGGYQLVAGERRFRAATKAGWSDVPVQVIEADDRQMAELALVENLQRKDLNALEKAASFQRYLKEYGSTQEELAARLKLDRSTISNFIRLLELPEEVQHSLRAGTITQGHARSLLPLGDEPEQVALCRRIHDEGLSVRQTEALVQEMIQQADAEPLSLVSGDGDPTGPAGSRPRRVTNEHVAVLEQQFRAALGARVKITHSSRGKGKLVVHFGDHDEFDRIREHICGPEHPTLRSQAG